MVVESKDRVWDHEVSQEEVCPQEVHNQDPRIWVEHTESLAKEMKGKGRKDALHSRLVLAGVL